jgi:hypothetical protein
VTTTPLASSPGSQFASELSAIESLSKVFASVLGALYLLGFLVVAINLSRYGVSSFSVLHLQYLVAGIWLLGPPVVYAYLTLTSRRFEENAVPEVPRKFNFRRFVFSVLISGIPSLLFLILLGSIPEVGAALTWAIVWRVVLFYLLMVNCAQVFWMARQETGQLWWINRSHAAPFYLAFLFVLMLCYAAWFSVHVYPLIPFSLGGGKPLNVVFFEGEKKFPDEIKNSDGSSKRSIPYKLLVATESRAWLFWSER